MSQSGAGAVDFAYLEGFLGGDRAIMAEVLGLFVGQAESWRPRLDPQAPDWREVVHSIKGSALGLGAHRLAEICGRAEHGSPDLLPQVRSALDEAMAEIEAFRASV